MSKDKLGELLDNLTFTCLYNRYKNLALNMFEWDGLPENMKPEYIEKLLYQHGSAVFFNDDNMGLLCLQATPSGGMNVYGEWLKVRPMARGEGADMFREYDMTECVLMHNNPMRINTHDYIMYYTYKLFEIERSLDNNVKIQKFPFLITCDDKDILTFKNIVKQIDENVLAIYTDKNLRRDDLDVLNLNPPFIADKLSDYRHDVTNELMTFLGINNANTDKRERLVTDEVNANNDAVVLNRDFMLTSRQMACDAINKMFGLNMSVKTREVEPSGSAVHDKPKGDN
jgi:hypothetical protein